MPPFLFTTNEGGFYARDFDEFSGFLKLAYSRVDEVLLPRVAKWIKSNCCPKKSDGLPIVTHRYWRVLRILESPFRTTSAINTKVSQFIENTGAKPLVVSSYKFTSQSVEKYYVIQEYIVQGCMPVAPGASVFVNALYIENLPVSAAFTYSVDLNVQGWIGTCEQAEGRLAEAIQFVTK